MSLQVPNYPDPRSTTPLAAAYAWVPYVSFDFAAGGGTISVRVNADAASAAAGLPGVDGFAVVLGSTLAPGVTFPTLAQLIQAAGVAAASASPPLDPFSAMRQAIYDALLQHPKLAGATEVP